MICLVRKISGDSCRDIQHGVSHQPPESEPLSVDLFRWNELLDPLQIFQLCKLRSESLSFGLTLDKRGMLLRLGIDLFVGHRVCRDWVCKRTSGCMPRSLTPTICLEKIELLMIVNSDALQLLSS